MGHEWPSLNPILPAWLATLIAQSKRRRILKKVQVIVLLDGWERLEELLERRDDALLIRGLPEASGPTHDRRILRDNGEDMARWDCQRPLSALLRRELA